MTPVYFTSNRSIKISCEDEHSQDLKNTRYNDKFGQK